MKLFRIMRVFNRYRDNKNSGARKDIVTYGIKSIIFSVLLVASMFLLSISINVMNQSSFFLGLVLLLVGIALGIAFLFYSVLYMIFQITLNRKIIGFIAIAILLAAIVGSIVILLTITI